MNIYNTDTKETISLTYAPTGCDCLGEISASDDQIKYNRETETHEANTATIEWWTNWITAQTEADAIAAAAREVLHTPDWQFVMDQAGNNDLEDQPRAIKAGMIEACKEEGMTLKTYADGSMAFVAA